MSDQKSYGFIYESTNEVNGMKYIGQTTQDESKVYFGSGVEIRKAIKIDGKENFTRVVLEWCPNSMELELAEIRIIKEHNAVLDPNYYNISPGGNVPNEETRQKMVENHKGMTGRILSDEHKRNISSTNKGNKMSGEQKRNLSIAKKGQKYSDEARRNMSQPRTEEHKRNISNAQMGHQRCLGYKQSDEHKQNISNAMRGKKKSPESCQKGWETRRRNREAAAQANFPIYINPML